jgi:hypothetical protein
MPIRGRRFRLFVVTLAIFFVTAPCLAWNYTGHRIIASIAYRQLDAPTRQRVAEILQAHPAAKELWAMRMTNGRDESLNLFWNASVFPDDARRPPWDMYSRPLAHFVNYRIMAEHGNRVEPPVDGENVLNSYVGWLRKLREPSVPVQEQALALSWVFHQAGDIHQPLHAVARFSKALPEGDRGGNGVTFPNPHAMTERGNNLHAYWDDLVGTDEGPAEVEKAADALMLECPRDRFTEELRRENIEQWAQESVQLSLKTVYRNLDPNITNFADRPVGYDADAQRVARRRAALAGYRLADELKRLFAKN